MWHREGAVSADLGVYDLCGGSGGILFSSAALIFFLLEEALNGLSGLHGQPGLQKNHTVWHREGAVLADLG